MHCTVSLLQDLLDKNVIPSDDDSHGKVFYCKMKGDYYRYMAEVAPEGEKRTKAVKGAQDAYKEALDVACEKLGPSDPVRLGLALNSSVFQYEIMNDPEEACKLAKEVSGACWLSVPVLHVPLHPLDVCRPLIRLSRC